MASFLLQRVPVEPREAEGALLEQPLEVAQRGQVPPVVLLDVLQVGRGQKVEEGVRPRREEARSDGVAAELEAV